MKLMASMLHKKVYYVMRDLDLFSQGHKGLKVENMIEMGFVFWTFGVLACDFIDTLEWQKS